MKKMVKSGLSATIAGLCCMLGARTVFAGIQPALNFDTWPAMTTWTNFTSNGWQLVNGEVLTIRSGKAPYSLPHAGWLNDRDGGTSMVMFPQLPYGVDRVSFWACNFATTGYNSVELQISTNQSTWTSFQSWSNRASTWTNCQSQLSVSNPVYLRLVKTADSPAQQYLGLDNIEARLPQGVALSNLVHAPAAPTMEDLVDISADAQPTALAGNVQLHAWYRFGTSGVFTALDMQPASNTLHRTTYPIPSGWTGPVEYYVSCDDDGPGPSPLFIPEGGPLAPLRYTTTNVYQTTSRRELMPSSHRTPLLISEFLYNAPPRVDGRSMEFIELFNTDPIEQPIGGYALAGSVDYVFPTNTTIPPRSFIVVARDPGLMPETGHAWPVYGPLTGSLPNGGGTIRLKNSSGAVLLEINYSDEAPWPAAPDGSGHSLTLRYPDFGEDDATAWESSTWIGGSPGRTDPLPPASEAGVLINEVRAVPAAPDEDVIELFNSSTQPVDISSWQLGDNATTPQYLIPTNTVLAAGAFLALPQSLTGIDLLPRTDMRNDVVFLWNSNATRVADAVRFSAMAPGQVFGRSPDGSAMAGTLAAATFGTTNAPPQISDIVINEIMFNPITGDPDDEYVELHNRGAAAVDVGSWQFIKGIAFTFPASTVIPPGGYLVVAKNAAQLRAKYPQLNAANTTGNFEGQLSGRGELLTLAAPLNPLQPSVAAVVQDEVFYQDGWGEWADGDGSSLELTDAHADNRLADNWQGSDETHKGTNLWVVVDHETPVDNAIEWMTDFRIFLQRAGECLIDDIQFEAVGGPTYFTSTFESGPGGWRYFGNHMRSSIETNEAYSGANSLHVRASGGGDAGSAMSDDPYWNRLTLALTNYPTYGGMRVRIKCKARWLAGSPYLFLTGRGLGAEAAVALPLPTRLGTPGMPNSRMRANAGPAIRDVQHLPVLPAANTPFWVQCRVADGDGIAAVTLNYRRDPVAVWSNVPMNDLGMDGDARAGDGIFTAPVPPQVADRTLAFTITAVDSAAATNAFPGPAPVGAPPLECIVRIGQQEPAMVFGSYRLWMSRTNLWRWMYGSMNGSQNVSRYSNEPIDLTLVYGGFRALYNAGGRFRGGWRRYNDNTDLFTPLSPEEGGAYALELPGSGRVMGDTEVKLDLHGQAGRDPTFQLENYCYWLGRQINLETPQIRFVNVWVNGTNLLVYHDLQTPALDFVESWIGDDQPVVFKNVGWMGDPLDQYIDADGNKKDSRYRFSWERKRPPAPGDDLTAVHTHADILATTNAAAREARVKALTAQRSWTSYFVMNAAAGNWDAYGFGPAHNMFAYMPFDRGSRLFIYDMDFAMGKGTGWRLLPGITLPDDDYQNATKIPELLYTSGEHPEFTRRYYALLMELANGAMKIETSGPYLDAWDAVFRQNGYSPDAPSNIKNWFSARRTVILNSMRVYEIDPELSVSSPAGTLTTTQSIVTVAGQASLPTEEIQVNGHKCRITFDSLLDWHIELGVPPGTNTFILTSFDDFDAVLGSATVTVVNTSAPSAPPTVVFSEIMYNPLIPKTAFVELHNPSASAVSLGGWQIENLGITFKYGTVLPPGGYGVVSENEAAYVHIYTNAEALIGTYSGALDLNSGTLRLQRPAGTDTWETVNEVFYSDSLPWPAAADGTGVSLQLVDPLQDNNHPANWACGTAGDPASAYTPGRGNSVALALPALPRLWIAEVMPQNNGVILDNYGERAPWIELLNADTAPVDLGAFALSPSSNAAGAYLIPGSIVLNPGERLVVWADGQTAQTTGRQVHVNFTLSPVTGAVALWRQWNSQWLMMDYISYAMINSNFSYGILPEAWPPGYQPFVFPTPGTTNRTSAGAVHVRLNEWMSSNTTIPDPLDGRTDDWLELFNPDDYPANLGGYQLQITPASPVAAYTIPAGTWVGPRQFLLARADEQPEQNGSGADLHLPFTLPAEGADLSLISPQATVRDAVSYTNQAADVTHGRWPDGADTIYGLCHPTPGGTNTILQLTGIARTNSDVHVEWSAHPGVLYALDGRPANTNDWTPLATVTALQYTGQARDTNRTDVLYYYRVRELR